MEIERTVDCRGLSCPQPVIETKAALAASATPVRVIVDSEASCTNVRRFAESQGARVSVLEQAGEFQLSIEPGHAAAGEEPAIACSAESGSGHGTVIYVSSETMGRGDEELGATLMAAFLDTLAQFQGISHAVFLNAGAKLAVEGSPVLPQLRQLEEMGVQVLVCGTCLRHFGIEDALAVGTVSNMYAIIETLSGAARILRP